MNILYLTEEPITFSGTMVRGGQIHVRNVVTGLRERGHDVHLVDWNDKSERVFQHSLRPIVRFGVAPFQTALRAGSIGQEMGADIVVSKTRKTYLPGLVAARVIEIPHVVHVGSSLGSMDRGLAGTLDTLSVRSRLRAPHDGYFVVCEALQQELIEKGIESERIYDVRNAVDTDRFHPERVPTPLDSEHQDRIETFAEGRFVLGFVGGLYSYKGLDDLADAIDNVDADCGVVVAGDGPERERLERRFGDAGLFLGPVQYEQIPALYHKFDAFVLPSHTEGLPRVVLEAQATGTPVIATSVGGVPEVVEDRVTGLLCESRSPEDLSTAIHELVDSPSERTSLARTARSRMTESYSWSRMYERYEEYLRRILSV